MNKSRLETFSDGVFAIVITLLVLDIRVPQVEYSHLSAALVSILPKIFSYVLSFVVIGVYWFSHHYYFRFIKKVNGAFIWLNIFMLMLIGFLPFPTSLLGEFPFRTIPVLLYGSNLLAINILSTVILLYVKRHPELAEESFTLYYIKNFWRVFFAVNLIYVAAIALSPFVPKVSYILYLIVLACLVFSHSKRD